MLKVNDMEYLEEVKSFAKSMGLTEQLQSKLDYLDKYGDGAYTVHLYTDFAPHSFYIVWQLGDRTVMNGGLIYHGPSGPGKEDRTQNFSVSLEDNPIGWRVHT